MMVVEIVAGVLFGSMALLADGLHMAFHGWPSALMLCLYSCNYGIGHLFYRCRAAGGLFHDGMGEFQPADPSRPSVSIRRSSLPL